MSKPSPTAAAKKPLPKKAAKPKESLVEWVMRDAPSKAERQAAALKELEAGSLKAHVPAQRQSKAASSAAGPKYVPLSVWAERMFGAHAPTPSTLMRWARDGHISPAPRKMGKQWFVKADAEYVE